MNRIAKLNYWAKPGVTKQSNELTSNEVTRNRITGKRSKGKKKKSERFIKLKINYVYRILSFLTFSISVVPVYLFDYISLLLLNLTWLQRKITIL